MDEWPAIKPDPDEPWRIRNRILSRCAVRHRRLMATGSETDVIRSIAIIGAGRITIVIKMGMLRYCLSLSNKFTWVRRKPTLPYYESGKGE